MDIAGSRVAAHLVCGPSSYMKAVLVDVFLTFLAAETKWQHRLN